MCSKKLLRYIELLSFEESLSNSEIVSQQNYEADEIKDIDKRIESEVENMTARKLEEFINLIETAEKIATCEAVPTLKLPG